MKARRQRANAIFGAPVRRQRDGKDRGAIVRRERSHFSHNRITVFTRHPDIIDQRINWEINIVGSQRDYIYLLVPPRRIAGP
jgi:hypothetical protein